MGTGNSSVCLDCLQALFTFFWGEDFGKPDFQLLAFPWPPYIQGQALPQFSCLVRGQSAPAPA